MAFLRRNLPSLLVLVATMIGIGLSLAGAVVALLAPVVTAVIVAVLEISGGERDHAAIERLGRASSEQLARAARDFQARFGTMTEVALPGQPPAGFQAHSQVTGVSIDYIAALMSEQTFNFVQSRRGDGWENLGSQIAEGRRELLAARALAVQVPDALAQFVACAADEANRATEGAYRITELYSGVNPGWPGARYRDADRANVESETAWREAYEATARAVRSLAECLRSIETYRL